MTPALRPHKARITVRQPLHPAECAAVLELATAATQCDGLHPLSEHVMLHLGVTQPDADQHVLAWLPASAVEADSAGADSARADVASSDAGPADPATTGSPPEVLAGYAHLDPTDAVAGASGEIVVHPKFRRLGLGRQLLLQLQKLAPDDRLRLWAHGEHPAAAALADALGYRANRQLWQLRRSLRSRLPEPAWPPGYRVRTFVAGRDDAAWLELNRAAFAGHPEQGSWTSIELGHRLAEQWFAPEGFFLVIAPDDTLAAFHWTKIHAHDSESAAHDPIGEVYIVGVHPAHRGRGLGAASTIWGLRWLRDQGLREVMLYVDADNAAAVHTYQRLGFTRWDTDVQYARAPRE